MRPTFMRKGVATLSDTYLPVQMDHIKVRENTVSGTRFTHGRRPAAPSNYTHFDGYSMGQPQIHRLRQGSTSRGLTSEVGTMRGDYDIRTQTQTRVITELVMTVRRSISTGMNIH